MASSPERLLRQIRLGEDTAFELKVITFRGHQVQGPRRKELADEIAAMANTVGGTLLLGVDDKTRQVIGIPTDRLDLVDRMVFEICNDSIEPPVAFHTFRLELPDSLGTTQAVLKIEIPRSLFVHKSPGGYFRRQGSSKRELPPDALARLFQQRSQARLIRFDEQAVPETTVENLEEELWRRFVPERPEKPRLTLAKLSLIRRDDGDVERATVAGVLMCTSHPERWLPSAMITAVRYRGGSPDANYQLDAQDIVGPLDRQISEALAFARRNMSVAATKAPGRIERPQYSDRALFEAIVNAVAHRDYSIPGSKIRLLMFDDRLELYSPGALPNTLTVESMALRQSTRNELVSSLLAKCSLPDVEGKLGRRYLMDKRGEGVPIIFSESKRLDSPVPTYKLLDDAELLLTLWAAASPTHEATVGAG